MRCYRSSWHRPHLRTTSLRRHSQKCLLRHREGYRWIIWGQLGHLLLSLQRETPKNRSKSRRIRTPLNRREDRREQSRISRDLLRERHHRLMQRSAGTYSRRRETVLQLKLRNCWRMPALMGLNFWGRKYLEPVSTKHKLLVLLVPHRSRSSVTLSARNLLTKPKISKAHPSQWA